MHANNEVGTIQPIAELAAHRPRARRAVPHRRRAGGRQDPDRRRARSASTCCRSPAHKFYGPKGVGALWMRRGTRLIAQMTGGRQERNRRAGTENVPAIVGLGVAAALARATRLAEMRRASPRCATARARHPRRASPARTSTAPATPRVANTTQHRLRRHRGRVAAHRARSRGHRGLDRLGVLVRHARAVARAQGDGPPTRTTRRTPSASASAPATPPRRSSASSRCCRRWSSACALGHRRRRQPRPRREPAPQAS